MVGVSASANLPLHHKVQKFSSGTGSTRWSWKMGNKTVGVVVVVYCGQMAGQIKMPLGMEVCFGPGHIVLDGDPAPLPRKGGHSPPPIFGPRLLWPNGWMDQDATWYDGRPWRGQHCVRCRPRSTPRGTAPPPIFGPCLLWPNSWMHQDAT